MKAQMILSVGMPRAGSGWYYNLTHDLVVAAGGVDSRGVRDRYRLGRFLTEVNCNIGTLSFYRLIPVLLPTFFEPAYVIKLHAGRRPFADGLIGRGIIKANYIYRDPRDALLSAYEYGKRVREAGSQNAFSHLETIEDAVRFMEEYVRYSEEWLANPHVLSTRYEELLTDYDREVGRVLEFLEIDPGVPGVREVMERYRPNQGSADQRGTHFVKGKIGRHREALTEEQLALCERVFGSYLEKQGYER